jgi:2-polyprenyl-6-methoxyphenol hydroxylase-like FAD-dependent oxidoreductase
MIKRSQKDSPTGLPHEGSSLRGLRVGIVGSSVAGLSAAWFLSRQGASVHVFERSASKLEERGGGIALDPAILPLLGEIRHCQLQERVVLDTDGRIRWEKELRKCTTSWSELYQTLHRHVPESVITRGLGVKGCESFREGVILRFENGSEERFDLVVGADGVGSVVRQAVDPEFRPRYLGYVALRGHISEQSLPAASEKLRVLADRPSMINCYGPQSHITAYWIPGRSGKALNWMCYLNVSEHDLSGYLSDESGHTHHWSLPPGMLGKSRRYQMLSEMHKIFPAEIMVTVEATENLSLQSIYYGISRHFVRDRIVLVGDAAHIAVPHIGAGSTFAIQDTLSLSQAMTPGNFDQSLNDWAARRHLETLTSLDVATRLGHSLQHENHDWKDWAPSDFETWWEGITGGTGLYFDVKGKDSK